MLSQLEMLNALYASADEQSEDEEPATTSADDEASKKATTEQQKQLSKKVCTPHSIGYRIGCNNNFVNLLVLSRRSAVSSFICIAVGAKEEGA